MASPRFCTTTLEPALRCRRQPQVAPSDDGARGRTCRSDQVVPVSSRESGRTEQARPPCFVDVGAIALVTAAVAVAGAVIAGAPTVHAIVQFLATAFEPIGTTDSGRIHPAALGLVLAAVAAFLLCAQLMRPPAHAHLDHDRVVEG